VTHDQEEAMTLADRIAIMTKGLLQQLGSPFEVYEKPSNMFVASFIGSPAMNMFEGELAEKNGDYIANFGIFSLPISKKIAQSISKELTLGIRPEHILLEDKKTAKSMSAKVEVTEPLGREDILLLNVGGVMLTANTRLMKPLNVGDEIWVRFAEAKLQLFDRKTTGRIELRPGA